MSSSRTNLLCHSFTEIPTIDLSLFEDVVTRPDVIAELHHALTNVGFLYISNHGVSTAAIDALVKLLPVVFRMPGPAKAEVALEGSPHFLGYSEVGSETTAGKTDAREQFEFATELASLWRPGLPLYDRLVGPNQWPSACPDVEPIVERYMQEMTVLGSRFLGCVEAALSLPAESLCQFLSEQHRLKLVHYPGNKLGNGQGVGPHKDSSGWWTFLLQASPPEVKGLQVLNKSGEWVDVPAKPGTFVVNIGQAFEVITHGVCPATTHRVLSGPLERYSVPFFQGVKRSLTRHEAKFTLQKYFLGDGTESQEGQVIDSAFLHGKYETWGEAQLRTKIRSHQTNGERYYSEVVQQYLAD